MGLESESVHESVSRNVNEPFRRLVEAKLASFHPVFCPAALDPRVRAFRIHPAAHLGRRTDQVRTGLPGLRACSHQRVRRDDQERRDDSSRRDKALLRVGQYSSSV